MSQEKKEKTIPFYTKDLQIRKAFEINSNYLKSFVNKRLRHETQKRKFLWSCCIGSKNGINMLSCTQKLDSGWGSNSWWFVAKSIVSSVPPGCRKSSSFANQAFRIMSWTTEIATNYSNMLCKASERSWCCKCFLYLISKSLKPTTIQMMSGLQALAKRQAWMRHHELFHFSTGAQGRSHHGMLSAFK